MAGENDPRNPGEGTPPPDPPQPPPPPVEPPPADPASNVPRETETEPRQDWRDRRIGEQQQRLRERNARIAELEAQLASQGQPPQPSQPPQYGQQPPPQPVGAAPGDIQRQINEAAARLASNQEFTRRCNEVAEQGRRVYGNFDQRVQRLVGLVDGQDQVQVNHYNDFLKAAMQTGQASRLIFELGGNLDEASRIMAMDPVGMTYELTRMSMRTGSEASAAPPPLTPIASAAQSNRTMVQPDDPETADTLDTSEWMRRRTEQMQTRRQRTLG